MNLRKTALAILAAPIAACSSLGTSSNNSSGAEAPSAPATTVSTEQSLGELAEAQIPEKACGMILWTLDAQRPSPVFRYISGEEANIVIGQTPVKLFRTEFNGTSGFGVFESQSFVSEDGVRVEVLSRFGVGFDGGSYLERGLIKVHAPDGWSIVAPAAGIAGCRT